MKTTEFKRASPERLLSLAILVVAVLAICRAVAVCLERGLFLYDPAYDFRYFLENWMFSLFGIINALSLLIGLTLARLWIGRRTAVRNVAISLILSSVVAYLAAVDTLSANPYWSLPSFGKPEIKKDLHSNYYGALRVYQENLSPYPNFSDGSDPARGSVSYPGVLYIDFWIHSGFGRFSLEKTGELRYITSLAMFLGGLLALLGVLIRMPELRGIRPRVPEYLALSLLIFQPAPWHCLGVGQSYIQAFFFFALFLLFYSFQRRFFAVPAGLFLGIATMYKMQIAFPAVALGLLWLFDRTDAKPLWSLFSCALSFVLTFAAQWAVPNGIEPYAYREFFTRVQNQLMSTGPMPYNFSASSIVVENLRLHTLFGWAPAIRSVFVALTLLFLLTIAYCVWRSPRKGSYLSNGILSMSTCGAVLFPLLWDFSFILVLPAWMWLFKRCLLERREDKWAALAFFLVLAAMINVSGTYIKAVMVLATFAFGSLLLLRGPGERRKEAQ